ncbi:CARDB protein [Hymenobacter gelipurpurascens]|uniref:CARDB protein n=1 Tax=Hymenobacter gelipurpurascens TaxID=89968 RepID=A0A212T335_9BACT|nr:C25 family cysteine peptidase [Hymenobacter gelipurpurascens]SNC60260.1 CARDB protein [Hymenobacter gelipurpurascens]
MKQPYHLLTIKLGGWVALLLAFFALAPLAAEAQSGPYGNEWIVPGQQYYRIKLARTGLYRLDYQYLTQAGAGGVSPQRLQLWRRGREVAIHVGGNQSSLDPTTFVEFFGQKNDAALDRGMFRSASDQAQPYFSMFTDTAAYFLTWSNVAPGKRMTQSNLTGTTPHASRVQKTLRVESFRWNTINDEANVYQSWAELGEGFFSEEFGSRGYVDPITRDPWFALDSIWSVNSSGQAPHLDIQVVGKSSGAHISEVAVVAPGGIRVLGTIAFTDYGFARKSFTLLPSDRAANGRVQIQVKQVGTGGPRGDVARVAYLRLAFGQTSRWNPRRSQLLFANDSTLAGPAFYALDSIPASVRGYDVTDPYNVLRVEGQALGANRRGYVFPQAEGRTRSLMLAEADRALVPGVGRRVQFRQISPAAHNFLIISSRVLMQPASGVTNPVRAYANYRASSAGGSYDTLVVTSEELYDQFHYGERSALAVRQFAQWMLAGSKRPMSLLLLGKGLGVAEYCSSYHRVNPEGYTYAACGGPDNSVVRNLVPASTRGVSDVFFTANWQSNDYAPRMATGRVSAQTPQQVVNYLSKLQEHEVPAYAEWRRNVLHMAGGKEPAERLQYAAFLEEYATYVRKPPFGGTVKTYLRGDYPGTTPGEAQINWAPDLNAGVSFISYFGHGDTGYLDWGIPNINNPASGINNKGKYPVMYVSGCSAGNSFRAIPAFGGDQYVLAADKGFVGFLSDSDLAFPYDLHEMHTEMVKLLFSDPQWYGKPVAEVQQEVIRRLQGTNSLPNATTAMLMNTIWQGDPALKLYSPLKPDYQVASVKVAPDVVPVTAPSFQLQVRVANPGRRTTGKLDIKVTRTFGTNTVVLPIFTVPQARRDTTYTLTIPNTGLGSIIGQNTFLVELDPSNLIDESDETNNSGTTTYAFLTGGVTTLSPPEFGIVGARTVRLVGQSNLPTTVSREYDMELDTVQTFNSPLIQRTTLAAVMVPEWSVTAPIIANRDSVVWYWRMRFHAPQAGEESGWATSSFRIISGRNGGWSQSHVGQFQRDEKAGITVAAPGGQWAFDAGSKQATITSTRIGPARQWETLSHTIRTSPTGSYTLRLIGIDANNNSVELNPNVTSRRLDLSTISATTYPYLQLEAVVKENGSGPAPQLEQWLIAYQGVPEGVVRPQTVALDGAALALQAKQQGKLSIPVTFQNVADFDFTNPMVAYILVRNDNNGLREKYIKLPGAALTAHTQRTYQVELDIRDLLGTLSGQIVLNPNLALSPNRQPELNYFNNEQGITSFQVDDRDTPPVLDVAFDGRHLLNGDIVSAQPIITVQLRDQDKLRPIKDRTAFNLFLTSPNGGATVPLNLNAANVTFVADSANGVARLEVHLGKETALKDGIYTLEVQGKDGSGKLAGSEPYRITFEVITTAGISNVFPYPNPVTSKAKFVFTLTGSEVPRNMKIQIMTLTGRVVREIMMSELGNLHIGNNITDYAWDGTDEFGDRLANGTYLYRVVLDDPQGKFEQRTTAADKAFKQGWGKLVLIR